MNDEEAPGLEEEPFVDVDRAFELVGHGRRQELMRALADQPDRTWHVASLASGIVTRGRTWPGSPEVRDVVVSLHHIHLPKLDDAGLVSYDPRTRTVADVDGEAIRAVFETIDRETADPGLA